MSRVTALVPALNEEGRVGPTVEAIRTISGVDEIVVIDGSSADGTAEEALRAGARVLVAPASVRGKGGALEGALERIEPADIYLLLDADLESTAKDAEALLVAVKGGIADLAIGVLPRQEGHGGFRLVKRTASGVIRSLTGFRTREPLSGQRAIRAEVLDRVRPLAPGFGVEVAMTIDAVRQGFRVLEIPVQMDHATTGRDLEGFLHRGRQGLDLFRATLSRLAR
ncbi:MAG: glycosyltransferase family 2 protein [Actinomycetota bacterium]